VGDLLSNPSHVNCLLVPTYEYVCTECGHTFEQFQSFSDDALRHCPECDGRLRKLFNAVGVVFKGSGFYRTDSRADATTAGAKGGAKDKAASGASGADSGSTSGAASKESSSGAKSDSSTSSTSKTGSSASSSGSKSSKAKSSSD
jgi:putative FmdB family regulatory protein